jgi:hypothetical protein
MTELKKEFEDKFVSEWGGQNQIVYEADKAWAWIEKQIKEAKIEYRDSIIKEIGNMIKDNEKWSYNPDEDEWYKQIGYSKALQELKEKIRELK